MYVRIRRVSQAAARFEGMQGTVVSDDRDGLPFGVSFRTMPISDAQTQADAYYALEELLPAGLNAEGLALRELPQRFSTAPPTQLAFAGVLGAANLGAVIYLGGMLGRVAGVPTAALGSAGPLVALLRRLYLPLLAYGAGFVGVPVARAAIVRRRNRQIDERNERRGAWGRALDGAQRGGGGGGKASGSGLRARVARKLEAARALRPRLRRFRRGQDAEYSTERGVAELAADAGAAPLAGSALDEFDRKLKERLGEEDAE